MDYKSEYDEYWSRSDRWGSHSFASGDLLAEQILSVCGRGKTLDVGFGMGLLVRTLVGKGVDADGIDIAQKPVDEANKVLPGRFKVGSILNIPFPDNTFETVISTDCLEHIAEEDVPKALAELCRVTRRSAFICLATTPDR
ncbi:MAG: class I SAM-dependent methyltransferase, partial [Limisphaerales bacterium]